MPRHSESSGEAPQRRRGGAGAAALAPQGAASGASGHRLCAEIGRAVEAGRATPGAETESRIVCVAARGRAPDGRKGARGRADEADKAADDAAELAARARKLAASILESAADFLGVK